MTWAEMVRKLEDLDRRLNVNETVSNETSRELKELKNGQRNERAARTIKTAVDPEVYEYLFDYCYDKKTGKPCGADAEKKNRNFQNLCNNIMMACGYVRPALNSNDNNYYAKVTAVGDMPEDEYKEFRKLLREVTALIYSFKSNRKKGEETNGQPHI